MPQQAVRLDWHAYFECFSAAHGGDPVPYQGRLLFRDGWMYSANDLAGPEWAAPKGRRDLDELVTAYWRSRLAMVEQERDELVRLVGNLRAFQETKSAPLQEVLEYWDTDQGRRTIERADLDFEALEERVDWLEVDIKECARQLNHKPKRKRK